MAYRVFHQEKKSIKTKRSAIFGAAYPGFEVKTTFGIILGRINNMKMVSFSHF